jgi:hypothetical protein
MVAYASKNFNLLKQDGLEKRKAELEKMFKEFGKTSHKGILCIFIL